MAIGVRELRNRITELLRGLDHPVVVTRHGKPAALLLPIDSPEAEDYVLAHAPDIVASLREADRDLKLGRTRKLGAYRRDRRL
jgi:prevent-host-death family protein